jgi:hypothetical protein
MGAIREPPAANTEFDVKKARKNISRQGAKIAKKEIADSGLT